MIMGVSKYALHWPLNNSPFVFPSDWENIKSSTLRNSPGFIFTSFITLMGGAVISGISPIIECHYAGYLWVLCTKLQRLFG